jgi:arginyl-tRNA synthetase
MQTYLTEKIQNALLALSYQDVAKLTFEKPKQEAHGDVTTNIAMLLAKAMKKNPRAVAQEVVAKLQVEPAYISKVEIAGPGFINFYFTNEFFTSQLAAILAAPDSFGRTNLGGGKKTQVEYVSANPTGPLSVGHGRQAALGDTLANLLAWSGRNRRTRDTGNCSMKHIRFPKTVIKAIISGTLRKN